MYPTGTRTAACATDCPGIDPERVTRWAEYLVATALWKQSPVARTPTVHDPRSAVIGFLHLGRS